jgi:hypothetical protein
MLLDPDEGVIVFLLLYATHMLVEVVVDILVAVTGIKGLQKQLMVVFPRKLL